MSEVYRLYDRQLWVGVFDWEGAGWYAPYQENSMTIWRFVGVGVAVRPHTYTLGLGNPTWMDAPPLPSSGEILWRETYCGYSFGPDIVWDADPERMVQDFFEEAEPNSWYSIEYGPAPEVEYHPFDRSGSAYPQVSIDELIEFVEEGLYE
jgi:hypothetical protein